MFDYNSDHKALIFSVSLNQAVQNADPSCSYRFIYKKTNWSKLQKSAMNDYNIQIPNDRNLTNAEINEHLLQFQNTVTKSIEDSVPRYKPQDNMLYYVNRNISSLHKSKSFLISSLNKLYKLNSPTVNTNNHINYIKLLIDEVNKISKPNIRLHITNTGTANLKLLTTATPNHSSLKSTDSSAQSKS